jgi:hypothetical protein
VIDNPDGICHKISSHLFLKSVSKTSIASEEIFERLTEERKRKDTLQYAATFKINNSTRKISYKVLNQFFLMKIVAEMMSFPKSMGILT